MTAKRTICLYKSLLNVAYVGIKITNCYNLEQNKDTVNS